MANVANQIVAITTTDPQGNVLPVVLGAGSAALGSVSVSNFPGTQTVSGTITANSQQGTLSSLNLTVVTAVKATAGRLARISVIVAGTVVGSANDSATTGGATAANQIFVIPNIVGVNLIDWPCLAGIVVTPGTGQTIAVSYI